MSCPCTAPDPWLSTPEPCLCPDADKLARAMDVLEALTRAAGEHASAEWMREWNMAYMDAENFLAANGRATSPHARRVAEEDGAAWPA